MKLSEHLVKNKARVSDIRKIKQINIWGCQLTDISLFLQMPFIEVLVLGNNQISSLYSLKNCHSLRELYLGRNLIESFEELKYLREAKSLFLLSLRDNPCAVAAGNSYRISVLRILPQLRSLDDKEFTSKERQELLSPDRRVEVTDRANYKSHENNPRNRFNLYHLDNQGAAEQEHHSAADTSPSFSARVPPLNLMEHNCNSSPSGILTAKDKAIASASACVNAVTQRREQELKDTISQYYPDASDHERRDRNATLLMAALALAKQMDGTTLEVLCRAIQDEVLKLPS